MAKNQGQNWPSKDHDLTIAVLETTFANINQSKEKCKIQNLTAAINFQSTQILA